MLLVYQQVNRYFGFDPLEKKLSGWSGERRVLMEDSVEKY